ncbi:MAG: alpha-galactosidase [Kiritimatiellae bacterium]|jgi:alpha-galactosidase|nr:alpha-galactosidase [Kiritimatiellia bacterium]
MKNLVKIFATLFFIHAAGIAGGNTTAALKTAGDRNMNIEFVAQKKLFVLTTENSTYAMGVNKSGALGHIYWGKRIGTPGDLSDPISGLFHVNTQEYPGWGEYFFDEPALKMTYSDGVRDTRLRYKEYKITENAGNCELRITLKDSFYPLKVDLVYKIYSDCDVIERHTIVTNQGKSPMTIESIQSAAWYLPRDKSYRLSYQTGRWGKEYHPQEWLMKQGKAVLESRRGVSGPDYTPFFWIDPEGLATEDHGDMWIGALHWAGNWKIIVENNRDNQTRITGGINDFDFDYVLQPAEEFVTPLFSCAFIEGGFGGASRTWHDYQRNHLMRPEKANALMPLIYNSWGAFTFDIDEKRVFKLAEIAAGIGVELFVIDDGWFAKRDNDKCSLGDWYPSPTKFPNGLDPMIKKINDLGMDFGIWLEPEMVSPDSELYRAHPEWVFQFENRTGSQYRHQLVLNLARDDVKEFVYKTMHDLLKNHNIKYFKLDNNRYISEPGWTSADLKDQKSVLVHYYRNFYAIFDRLTKEFPDVLFENCASGSGRVDFSMHRNFDRINRSDNQDPLDMLYLHEGFARVNLPKLAGGACHISTSMAHINGRHAPMRYQAHIGMLGSLAIGQNLFNCTPEQLKEMKGYVDTYKDIRHITQRGDYYQLLSPRTDKRAVYQYVSKDKSEAVLFVLGQSMQFRDKLPNIRLQGLNPDTLYTADGYKPMSGAGLMNIGIPVNLRGDFDSKLIQIRKK